MLLILLVTFQQEVIVTMRPVFYVYYHMIRLRDETGLESLGDGIDSAKKRVLADAATGCLWMIGSAAAKQGAFYCDGSDTLSLLLGSAWFRFYA